MTLIEARNTFARLMATARSRTLTAGEKQRLTEARQLLRRAKRPAMNPRKSRILTPKGFTSGAYRGYLIRSNHIGEFWIEKDGYLIQYVKSVADGQRVIDELLQSNPKLTRSKARTILHEGKARGRTLTERQRRFFGARASGYPVRKNPERRFGVFIWTASGKYPLHKAVKVFASEVEANAFVVQHPRELYVVRPIRPGKQVTESFSEYSKRLRKMRGNPRRSLQRLGRALEIRYKRDIGRQPGYYKHEIRSQRAGLYTVSEGWVYVPGRSILIAEGKPRV